MSILLLAVFGGLGAVCRFWVDAGIRARVRRDFPLGTLLINLAGSFLLGLLAAGVVSRGWSPELKLVLGTGFCGGFTTFSTASVETVRLWLGRRRGAALGYALANALGCVGFAALGYLLGR